MNFTDKYISSLKPKDKPYYIREARGFALRVLPSGLKTFFYIYTLGGKRKYLNLKDYGVVSLAQARVDYQNAYNAHHQGIDLTAPLAEQVQQEDNPVTFGDFYKLYDEYSKINHKPVYYSDQLNAIHHDVLPYWADIPLKDINRRAAIKLLERVQARSKGQTKNTHNACRNVFDYALQREYIEYNPMLNLTKVLSSLVYTPRSRVLTEQEIKTVWNSLDDSDTHRILKLILITAQRPGEVAGIHRNEIEGDTWCIPKERAEKGKRDHIVPLTKTALDLLPDGEGRLFNVHRVSVSQNVQRVLEYCGLPRWTPHDLRRTARTYMAKIGVIDEHAEAVLNHAKPGMVGVYNKYQYQNEKRTALLKWEAELLRILHEA